jgi:hypothetical protein
MVNQTKVPSKQKVITLNKSISYSGSTNKDVIVENSIKALQIVKKIEAQGYRVNLNIVLGTEKGGERIIAKIRIKNANERLNVSKVAFPLVHPSMLRRLLFRYIEVNPNVKSKGFVGSYGTPVDESTVKSLTNDEYMLPKFIGDVEKEIKEILKK